MRCSAVRKGIARLSTPFDLEGRPELRRHADGCLACRRVLEDHLLLLDLLSDPPPPPVFADLTALVLDKLDGPMPSRPVVWRWAAAAALALAGLALGFRLGVGASASAETPRPIVSTYQEALYGLPSDSTEMAYLDNASSVQSTSERSLP
jgi:hypothetical protein